MQMKSKKKNQTSSPNKPNHEDYDSIGLFLRDFRTYLRSKDKSKFTQQSVSKICGYTCSQHISNIEREMVLPSMSLSVKLMKLYGIESKAMYELFMKHREAQYKKAFLLKKIK
jgi:DNA-binding XRE family transcriptional regulator